MNHIESTIEYSLGIDISKKDFHAAILRHEDRKIIAEKSFLNTAKGMKEHITWISKHCGKEMFIQACLEATGTYGDSVAIHLHKHLSKVSLVNPRAIKNFGAMQLRRDKSDKADARLIAQYCHNQQPSAWQPPSEAQAKTKALARRLSQLKCDLTRENNRLEATSDKATRIDIKDHLKSLTKRIAKLENHLEELIKNNPENKQTLDLLTSINGIGKKSGTQIISELPDLTNFPTGRELSAYAGVTPRHFQSGTSGKTRTPMSKAGNSQLRKHLFFPAMSAMRYNPICKEFAARLKAQGKPQIVIIGAIMNKLLHIIYGVLKHQKPFDPEYLKKHEKSA
jgi:transposase